MGLAPCKGCSDRTIDCHSHCGKYQKFVAENNERREKECREGDVIGAIRDGQLRVLNHKSRASKVFRSHKK